MSDVKVEYYNSQGPEKKKIEARWWNLPEAEVFQHLLPLVEAIKQRQAYRQTANLLHARLYSNLDISGLIGGAISRTASDLHMRSRLGLNVVMSCVDTAASKIAGTAPRPLFLTEEGNWSLQREAKQLTKFVDGAFEAAGVDQLRERMFVDACVFGTGAIKFYEDEERGQVCAERAFIDEIVVDDTEGIYGKPMQLHQQRLVNKDVLIEMFPEKEAMIRQATAGKFNEQNAYSLQDMAFVTESWKLPSGPTAKDGRHAMAIDSCTLYSVPYEGESFPFAVFRWKHRLSSWYGMGLAEELLPIQLEINKILRTIQAAQHLIAVPRVYLENNSMVNTQHINNDIASIVKYTGTPPIFGVSPAMPPEMYSHLKYLVESAYQITGISQLSAQSKKPGGLDSGVALREYQDIESERFKIVGKQWERHALDCAKLMISMTRSLAKRSKKVSVKVGAGRYAETIKWSDIDLDEQKYVMRCYPTSMLPTTPAGKLQTVQELAQAGFIDRETAMDLLDFPDTEAAIAKQLAPRRIVMKLIEQMVDKGEYQPPEPQMDLSYALKLTQQSYLDCKMQGVPEDQLELLRTFMDDCSAELQLAAQAAQAKAAPPPPMPTSAPPEAMAQPEMPPVSELIPNVPV